MTNENYDCKIKPKGKGLKAFRRLKNFEAQVSISKTRDKLKVVHTKLKEIMDENNKVVDKEFLLSKIISSCAPKKRSMIADMPERIEFKLGSINFYIDFTIEASMQGEKFDVKASIIYGTNRLLCFVNCPPVSAPDNSASKKSSS